MLVIDPGGLTEPAALDGVDAVLVTHEHPDHLNVNALANLLGKRPSVTVHTHPSVVPKLDGLAGVVFGINPGDSFEAAGLPVRAYGGWHAEIHPDLPRVPNLGFLVNDSIYHPGDSFDVPEGARVDTLFVPVSAPWLRVAESVDFVRAVAPRRAYALHDGILNDAGHMLTDTVMGQLSRCDYARLAPGTTID